MNGSEKNLTRLLGKILVESMSVSDNDPIEDQFRYWSLKIGVELPDLIPDNLTVDQQDKLILVYKRFWQEIKEIKGE